VLVACPRSFIPYASSAALRARTGAFGAVVYEMVTGRKAFEGKGQASLIHAIMGVDPPPMSALESMTPPALDRAVRTCLSKDPEEVRRCDPL
jgi:serine/threonine protein kinase